MFIGLAAVSAFFVIRSWLTRFGVRSIPSIFMAAGIVTISLIACWGSVIRLKHYRETAPATLVAVPEPTSVGSVVHSARLRIRSEELNRLVLGSNVPADGYIDSLNGISVDPQKGPLSFPVGSTIRINGWACEPSGKPGAALMLIVDSTQRIDVTRFYGTDRPDVALNLGMKSMEFSGFEKAPLSTAKLSRGSHKVEIGVISADRMHYYLVHQIRYFDLH